jgi:hypothetical protein
MHTVLFTAFLTPLLWLMWLMWLLWLLVARLALLPSSVQHRRPILVVVRTFVNCQRTVSLLVLGTVPFLLTLHLPFLLTLHLGTTRGAINNTTF